MCRNLSCGLSPLISPMERTVDDLKDPPCPECWLHDAVLAHQARFTIPLGRRHRSTSEDFFPNNMTQTEEKSAAAPTLPPDVAEDQKQCKIDKSQLAIAEPKRLRDKAHLKLVASQPCLVCGRQPSDPHHLRFAQPRAIGLKVSDEFTVPLCRGHHRELHQTGNEKAWWEQRRIRVLEVARGLWEQSHPLTVRHSSSPTEK